MGLNHKRLCLFFLGSDSSVASSLDNKSSGGSGGTQAGSVPADVVQNRVAVYVAYSADPNVYIKCFHSSKITMVMVPKTKALAFCHG